MNGWNEISDEKELILKLFNTGHLNVPERGNLPEGKVRVSIAQKVIKEGLQLFGWFPGPQQFPVGDEGGSYIQLEIRQGGKVFLHHNFEISFLKYDHKTIEFGNMDIAIKEYLQERDDEGLDGLNLDWDS